MRTFAINFSGARRTECVSDDRRCLFWTSERKVLRDCYMYPARCKLSLTARGARGDQRISVISSTSSNTTSGIVSDRVHSEDEPDTAPASTECLPRLTENTSYPGVVNGANADVEDRSMPSSPVSTVDGKLTSILQTQGIQR